VSRARIQQASQPNNGTISEQHRRQDTGFDENKKPYHDAGLLDLVHLGNLLGHFGLGHVGLSGVDNVDALTSMSKNRSNLGKKDRPINRTAKRDTD
jgi:hypothetical protein